VSRAADDGVRQTTPIKAKNAEEGRGYLMAFKILKELCIGGIGAIDFSREKLSDLRETLADSMDEFVERGERLNESEDSLVGALLAALQVRPRIPTLEEIEAILPGFEEMKVSEIVDQLKRLPLKQLDLLREYEYHNYNRLRIIRQIDKELDEARVIPDYDDLAVGEVVEQLEGLPPQQLVAVKDYEKTHRNRATVIRAIDRWLASPA
jgi:hypothetical protein